MPRYPVEHVRTHGSGHAGTPSVVVAMGTPQGGSSQYVVFEETTLGPRAVAEIRRDEALQSIHIPMDFPPTGTAKTVVMRGIELREAVQQYGDDTPQAVAAAQRFVDAVERFIAEVYSA